MLELVFMRHGRTDWNNKRLVMGRRPVPLNVEGRAQAERSAKFLGSANFEAVVTSPVARAIETAEIIARHGGLTVERDERLAEIDYGDWVGRSFSEVAAQNPAVWEEYHTNPGGVIVPGGEAIADVVKRVGDAMGDIQGRFHDGRVAIVSHADVIKIAILHLLDLDLGKIGRFTIDNCAIMLVRVYQGVGPRLVAYGAGNLFEKDV